MKENIFETCSLSYDTKLGIITIWTKEKQKFVFDINDNTQVKEIAEKIKNAENLVSALRYAQYLAQNKNKNLFANKHVQNQVELTKKVYDYYNNKKEDRNLAQSKKDGYVFHHFGFGPTQIDIKTASDEDITLEVQRQEHLVADRLIDALNFGNENYNTLDIGCGRGGNMFKVADKVYNTKLEGINIADYHIDFCKKEIKRRDMTERVGVTLGDFMSMPYQNNEFSHAYCSEVTQYAHSLKNMFNEVSRVLKKDGIFVILTWCYNEKSDTKTIKDLVEPINDHYASTMHSDDTYKKALKENNLELITEEDRTDDLIAYWELRNNWSMKSGIEEYFIKGHKNRDLLYKIFVAKKL